ncbi:MAG: inner membrane CreD family protein [Bacteroidales bacterium]|jgi:inner membrane protein|nr:inner membrane CreD family protein [Bacteroidales bacterium]
METTKRKFTQTLTFKGITIGILILLLLIPGAMIQDLIRERQERSQETIQKISDKWSLSQTLCAPILIVPYTTTKLDQDQKQVQEEHILYITPKDLKINTSLTPEERHYGIYKAILYKSDIHFEGSFDEISQLKIENSVLHYDKAQLVIGITDLRGVVENPDITIGNKKLETTIGIVPFFTVTENIVVGGADKFGSREDYVKSNPVSGKTLVVDLKDLNLADSLTDQLDFSCQMKLNGSSSINFIPIGQNTHVTLSGEWNSPSFIGSFSPESNIEKKIIQC